VIECSSRRIILTTSPIGARRRVYDNAIDARVPDGAEFDRVLEASTAVRDATAWNDAVAGTVLTLPPTGSPHG
jgi:hypothetical protein